MSFLAGLAADVVEWILGKVFALIGKNFAEWQAQRKSDKALAANQAALQSAIKSGGKDELAQSAIDSLNNSGGN